MTDEVFMPHPAPRGLAAPGSAEVLYLRAALFVLRGTFHDPIAGEPRPLPPHRFVLVHDETVFSEGTTSDADGISTIFAPTVPEDLAPDAPWELWLVPIYPGRADSDAYAEEGEGWLDVEARVWATSEAVRQPTQIPGSFTWQLTDRKLLKIPFWTSTRQAAHGGFVDGPAHAAQWAETGLLQTRELVPHGTREEPWQVAIDHGWMRTYVQLRYYDFAAREERPIPAGIVLRAIDERNGHELGASSVRLDGGSFYVLHGQPPERAEGLQYFFQTPMSSATFELEGGALELGPRFDLEKLATHYLLPRAWCSRGMEAWTGGGDASADVRKPFSGIRDEGQNPEDPLCFHLDDAVLLDHGWDPIDPVDERICVLDSRLAIRDQARNGVGVVPWSDRALESALLRAEEYVFVRGEGITSLARVFEHGGWMFEHETRRVPLARAIRQGHPVELNLVGARAARLVSSRSPFSIFAAQFLGLLIVDTTYLRVEVGEAAAAKLAHLLVYQGFYLDTGGDDLGKEEVEHGLFASSQVWDQTHPAHEEHFGRPGPRKDYFICSRAEAVTASSVVVKLRHHFGLRTTQVRVPKHEGVDVEKEEHRNAPILLRAEGRASMGMEMKLYRTHEGHPTRRRSPFAFGPDEGTVKDRLDDVEEPRFTLSHELGHAIGLPDEYRENWSPRDTLARMPRFDQGGRILPFSLDGAAAMGSKPLSRLRYAWPYVRWMAEQAAFSHDEHWLSDFFPCEVRHKAGSRLLRYTLGDDEDPWEPVHTGKGGRCDLELFRLGDDESSRGPMFVDAPDVFDELFDGVIVVHCKLWFDFEDRRGLAARWNLIWNRLGSTYQRRSDAPRFFVQGPPGAPDFRRVPIVIVPRVQFGPKISDPLAEGREHLEVLGVADVRVVVGGRSDPSKDLSASPPELRLRRSAVGHGILRFALDPEHQPRGDMRAPLSAADLAPVSRWLATALGRAPGEVRPYG